MKKSNMISSKKTWWKKKKSREVLSTHPCIPDAYNTKKFVLIFKVLRALTMPQNAVLFFNLGETWQKTAVKIFASASRINTTKITFSL